MKKEVKNIFKASRAYEKTLDILGYTNVHIDFHTPDFQTNVGQNFNGDRFARQLKDSHVDSITFFASCYHGYSYYNTKVGTKHPHLRIDLLHKRAYFKLDDYKNNLPDIECASYRDFQAIAVTSANKKASIIAPSGGGERFTGNFPGPPGKLLDAPAITYNTFGEGEAVYIGTNLFTQYYEMNYHAHRTLLDNIISSLQKVRVLSLDAPPTVWANAMKTSQAVYIHLTNYHAEHQGSVFPRITCDPPPIDVTVKIYAPHAKNVAPITDVKIDVEHDHDYLKITLYSISIHEIVRIERSDFL